MIRAMLLLAIAGSAHGSIIVRAAPEGEMKPTAKTKPVARRDRKPELICERWDHGRCINPRLQLEWTAK